MTLRVNRQNGWMSAIGRLAMDVAVFNVATVLAVLARLDFGAAPWSLVYIRRFPGLVENLVFVAVSVLLQTPLALWSYASLRDMERVAVVVAVTKVLALPLLLAMRGEVPWSRGHLPHLRCWPSCSWQACALSHGGGTGDTRGRRASRNRLSILRPVRAC